MPKGVDVLLSNAGKVPVAVVYASVKGAVSARISLFRPQNLSLVVNGSEASTVMIRTGKCCSALVVCFADLDFTLLLV